MENSGKVAGSGPTVMRGGRWWFARWFGGGAARLLPRIIFNVPIAMVSFDRPNFELEFVKNMF